MNLYKPEIKLTSNVDRLKYACGAVYFQEYTTVCSHGVQICAKGLHRYVKLPKDTREITVRFYTRYVVDSFEIGRKDIKRSPYSGNSLLFDETRCYCLLDHPNVQLLLSFRSELYRYYINGYKFFRIEY